VKNLSEVTTDESLMDVFKAYGAIESVRVLRDKQTGLCRGFGFVNFPSEADATAFMDIASV